MRAHVFQLSYGWDRVIASDPDLTRLKMGLRAMLGIGLSLAAIAALGTLFHQPVTLGLTGVMTGMTVPINVQDRLPRDQRITLLSALPVAVASVCLGTLAAASLRISALVFLLVVFLAVSARRFGPRGLALGMIAFMTFFLSLFFHAPVAQLPWVITCVAVGAIISYGVRIWLVPDRSNASLRRTFAAFRTSITLLLADLSDVLDMSNERRRRSLIQRALWRVNTAALAVEQHLEGADPEILAHGLRPMELREHLLDLELTAERLVFEVSGLLGTGQVTPQERRALARRLLTLRRELRDAGAAPVTSTSTASSDTDIDATLEQLRELFSHPPRPRADTERSQEDTPTLGQESRGSGSPPSKLDPSTRQAIQATVACGLALFAGHRVSNTRWYWAVIAAFVIFNRASTQGDILLRAWHRILGTVIGVASGIFLATLVSGHRHLEISLIFVCVFLGFYLIRISYAWMVFWFTTLLSLLYSLLGRYSPRLLFLRVEETLIGAGIGALVAVVLLPSRTGARVQQAVVAALHGVASFLDGASALPGGLALERVREIDAKLQEVRDAVRPLTARKFLADRNALRLVHALSGLGFFVRQLAATCARRSSNEEDLRSMEARIAQHARIVASSVESERSGKPWPIHRDSQSPHQVQAPDTNRSAPTSSREAHWLERIDDALLEVYESLSGFRSRHRAT